MHLQSLNHYQHLHEFHTANEENIKKVILVIIITLITMTAEIIFGWLYNSMALLSDGWHMATHSSALSITLLAYFFAKKYKKDPGYSFGTWKMEILGAYTSAIILSGVGVFVIVSSIERIFNPVNIKYDQALIIAVIGLAVNIICAFILNLKGHDHGHKHPHDHDERNADLNIKSAYLHVIADALTSIFAIIALLGAKLLKLNILDPFMGMISSILIFRWSYQLFKETSGILLDKSADISLRNKIKILIEDHDAKISDLHLWRVASEKYSCIITIVAHQPKELTDYKKMLRSIHELSHISIEIINCAENDTHCPVEQH